MGKLYGQYAANAYQIWSSANTNFPLDSNRRKFSVIHYKRRLVNGEYVSRSWLQYSVSRDAVFCFCCKLFTKNSNSALISKGFNDWKNLSCHLSSHEKTACHLENYQKWRELELRLRKNKTIDEENMRLIGEEEKYWQQILERLIALVRLLACQNLPLRGTHDRIFTAGNGNFLKIVEYMSLFHPIMNEHLRRIEAKETHVHYLGKCIQNELVNLLAVAVQTKIIDSVNSAKYFSIILDCTPDVSHVEQMTIIVRFLNIKTDNNVCKSEIKEHFLGFIPINDTTGANLTEKLLAKLNELSLPLENLRGQGYDNGSNMKGKHSGVQKRILNENPRAFFVPCSSHTLNLVVNDAAKCCLAATSFFYLVQSIYIFFSASTQRWDVLLRHVHRLTLKPLSETRWESRIDALRPLRFQLADIHDAFIDIYEDKTLIGSCGNQTRIEAKALAGKIDNFNFIASLVVWYNILLEINLTSKLLQSMQYDVNAASNELLKTKTFIESCRSDVGFEKMLEEAKLLAEELSISPLFTSGPRLRKKKRQFNYEAEDDPILNAKIDFKINFYFAVLDTAIVSIDERFQQLQYVKDIFGFIFNIHELNNTSVEVLLKHCQKLEKSLTHGDSKDIEACELCSEIQAVCTRIANNTNPQEVLDYIFQNKLEGSVPNLANAIKILLTLPVSVASGERSFSKLKLIKTYLRSTMSQERLVGLSTLSIESEIAEKIDLKTVVSEFAKSKARKVKM